MFRINIVIWLICWGIFFPQHIFALPNGRDSLYFPTAREVREKGRDYWTEHYWERFPFNDFIFPDTTLIAEQGFVNFLGLVETSKGTTAVEKGVADLVKGMTGREEAWYYFEEMTVKYLYDVDSPYCNPKLLKVFLNVFREASVEEIQKERAKSLLELIERNVIGNPVEDVSFRDMQGEKIRLRQSKGKMRLLVLYDWDCDACRVLLDKLSADSLSSRWRDVHGVGVVAIYLGENKRVWQSYAETLPDWWIHGIDGGRTRREGRFDLQKIPLIFLLDAENRVLLKERNLDEIIKRLK